MGTKILVVDDERLLVKALKHSLEREGYEVVTAYDGEEALRAIDAHRPDIVVLDIMLPRVDGFTICRKVRQTCQVPIIMLTAKADDIDKILGLELGADDYLTKPFNTRELVARIRAILRRAEMAGQPANAPLRAGDLEIDRPARRVTRAGRRIELTPKEFDVLCLLAANPGRVFSREEILRRVWGYEFYGDTRTVDVHVRRLREKVEPDPSHPVYILTSWGAGYCFREEN